MADRMQVDLPSPPSVNKMYRSVVMGRAVRVLKSREYRAWLKLATERLALERERFAHCLVLIHANVSYRRDVDGLAKATLDALEAAGIVSDDRYVEAVWVGRDTGPDAGRMWVTVQGSKAAADCSRCKRGKHNAKRRKAT